MSAATKKDNAAQEASKAAAKRLRLPYTPPWMVFYPTALLFIMVNYLAFGSITDETESKRLLPPYLVSYAASRDYKREIATAGSAPAESSNLNALLFFEEHVMGFLFDFGMHIFRSMFGIQMMCIVAWLIHLFELGMCFRICFSCNATLPTTALYMLCTALAGFAQLVPLMGARNEWVEKVKGAGEAAAETPAQESKKKK